MASRDRQDHTLGNVLFDIASIGALGAAGVYGFNLYRQARAGNAFTGRPIVPLKSNLQTSTLAAQSARGAVDLTLNRITSPQGGIRSNVATVPLPFGTLLPGGGRRIPLSRNQIAEAWSAAAYSVDPTGRSRLHKLTETIRSAREDGVSVVAKFARQNKTSRDVGEALNIFHQNLRAYQAEAGVVLGEVLRRQGTTVAQAAEIMQQTSISALINDLYVPHVIREAPLASITPGKGVLGQAMTALQAQAKELGIQVAFQARGAGQGRYGIDIVLSGETLGGRTRRISLPALLPGDQLALGGARFQDVYAVGKFIPIERAASGELGLVGGGRAMNLHEAMMLRVREGLLQQLAENAGNLQAQRSLIKAAQEEVRARLVWIAGGEKAATGSYARLRSNVVSIFNPAAKFSFAPSTNLDPLARIPKASQEEIRYAAEIAGARDWIPLSPAGAARMTFSTLPVTEISPYFSDLVLGSRRPFGFIRPVKPILQMPSSKVPALPRVSRDDIWARMVENAAHIGALHDLMTPYRPGHAVGSHAARQEFLLAQLGFSKAQIADLMPLALGERAMLEHLTGSEQEAQRLLAISSRATARKPSITERLPGGTFEESLVEKYRALSPREREKKLRALYRKQLRLGKLFERAGRRVSTRDIDYQRWLNKTSYLAGESEFMWEYMQRRRALVVDPLLLGDKAARLASRLGLEEGAIPIRSRFITGILAEENLKGVFRRQFVESIHALQAGEANIKDVLSTWRNRPIGIGNYGQPIYLPSNITDISGLEYLGTTMEPGYSILRMQVKRRPAAVKIFGGAKGLLLPTRSSRAFEALATTLIGKTDIGAAEMVVSAKMVQTQPQMIPMMLHEGMRQFFERRTQLGLSVGSQAKRLITDPGGVMSAFSKGLKGIPATEQLERLASRYFRFFKGAMGSGFAAASAAELADVLFPLKLMTAGAFEQSAIYKELEAAKAGLGEAVRQQAVYTYGTLQFGIGEGVTTGQPMSIDPRMALQSLSMEGPYGALGPEIIEEMGRSAAIADPTARAYQEYLSSMFVKEAPEGARVMELTDKGLDLLWRPDIPEKYFGYAEEPTYIKLLEDQYLRLPTLGELRNLRPVSTPEGGYILPEPARFLRDHVDEMRHIHMEAMRAGTSANKQIRDAISRMNIAAAEEVLAIGLGKGREFSVGRARPPASITLVPVPAASVEIMEAARQAALRNRIDEIKAGKETKEIAKEIARLERQVEGDIGMRGFLEASRSTNLEDWASTRSYLMSQEDFNAQLRRFERIYGAEEAAALREQVKTKGFFESVEWRHPIQGRYSVTLGRTYVSKYAEPGQLASTSRYLELTGTIAGEQVNKGIHFDAWSLQRGDFDEDIVANMMLPKDKRAKIAAWMESEAARQEALQSAQAAIYQELLKPAKSLEQVGRGATDILRMATPDLATGRLALALKRAKYVIGRAENLSQQEKALLGYLLEPIEEIPISAKKLGATELETIFRRAAEIDRMFSTAAARREGMSGAGFAEWLLGRTAGGKGGAGLSAQAKALIEQGGTFEMRMPGTSAKTMQVTLEGYTLEKLKKLESKLVDAYTQQLGGYEIAPGVTPDDIFEMFNNPKSARSLATVRRLGSPSMLNRAVNEVFPDMADLFLQRAEATGLMSTVSKMSVAAENDMIKAGKTLWAHKGKLGLGLGGMLLVSALLSAPETTTGKMIPPSSKPSIPTRGSYGPSAMDILQNRMAPSKPLTPSSIAQSTVTYLANNIAPGYNADIQASYSGAYPRRSIANMQAAFPGAAFHITDTSVSSRQRFQDLGL